MRRVDLRDDPIVISLLWHDYGAGGGASRNHKAAGTGQAGQAKTRTTFL